MCPVSILVICLLVATRSNAGITNSSAKSVLPCQWRQHHTAGAALYYQVLLVCTPAAGRNLVMLSSTRFCTWYPVVPSTGHQKMVLWYLVPGTRYHDDTSGGNLVMLPGFMHSSTGITAPAQCCWYQVGRSMVPGCTFIHSLLSAPLILLLAFLYLSLRSL